MVICLLGDEVIILVFYWVSYLEMVKFVGVMFKIVFVDDKMGFFFILEMFEVVIMLKMKFLVFNLFLNFFGVVYLCV